MDKDFHKEFNKCPCCGSEERFLEQLGKDLKDRGLAREEWNFHLDVKQGVVVDPQKAAGIPIGSNIPGYGLMTDICMNCGCVYATDLTRSDAKKSIDVSHMIPPGRGQRRRDARQERPPGLPFSKS